MNTLGSLISKRRKEKGLTLVSLASKVPKEDGHFISPQFLCDIENSRRFPSNGVLKWLAIELDLIEEMDYLYYLVGRWAPDLREPLLNKEAFSESMTRFRRTLGDR